MQIHKPYTQSYKYNIEERKRRRETFYVIRKEDGAEFSVTAIK